MMADSRERIALLMGGVGSRLWPHSRASLPKQFLKLSGGAESILVESLRRFEDWAGAVSLLGTKELESITRSFLNLHQLDVQIYSEPRGCNTAAAIALLCKIYSFENEGIILGVFPSDHHIPPREQQVFRQTVKTAFQLAEQQQKILTIGIKPHFPSTAYGYIQQGDACEQAYAVEAFREKPTLEKAQQFLAQGNVCWNAGMFIFPVKLMIAEFKAHMPELWAKVDQLKTDLSNIDDVYSDDLVEESIDYGIMEKSSHLLCLPGDFSWSDLGSWESVAELQTASDSGEGNNYIPNENLLGKQAFFVGVQDVIVADTNDAVLVLKKGQGQDVKKLYKQLTADNSELVFQHPFEYRPWGWFKILKDTDYFKSKIICVYPKQRLSYQSHKHRSEHWVMVKGQAEVILNDQSHKLSAGESIHIPLGAKHRIINPGDEDLEFIEVQTGTYFGEDDIVRYSDDYGRQ